MSQRYVITHVADESYQWQIYDTLTRKHVGMRLAYFDAIEMAAIMNEPHKEDL